MIKYFKFVILVFLISCGIDHHADGEVLSAEDNLPIVHAEVSMKGKTVFTGDLGEFDIEVKDSGFFFEPENANVYIKKLGYKDKKIKEDRGLKIFLQRDDKIKLDKLQ